MLSVKIERQSADKSSLQHQRLWWTSEGRMQDMVNESNYLCALVFGFVQSCWVCMSVCVSVVLYVCTCLLVRMCAIFSYFNVYILSIGILVSAAMCVYHLPTARNRVNYVCNITFLQSGASKRHHIVRCSPSLNSLPKQYHAPAHMGRTDGAVVLVPVILWAGGAICLTS
jgi:hypothetical protein